MTSAGRNGVAGTWTASPPPGFGAGALTRGHVWDLLLAARRLGGAPPAASGPASVRRLDADGAVREGNPEASTGARTLLELGPDGWRAGDAVREASDDARAFLELHLPALAGGTDARFVVAHLGQSVDGWIAAASGHAFYVTGPENLAHLHRLRALCDAVVLGAGSVAADDPRLTVRLVAGESPVRVVIDPDRRLGSPRRVFDDGEAETVVASRAAAPGGAHGIGRATRLVVDAHPERDGIDLGRLLDALAARGLRRVFVEGGGTTVSGFVEDGLVDRLHVAVAPVLIGRGVPGLRLPPVASMDEAWRPPCRLHRMDEDVLWDFDLASLRRRGEGAPGRA